MAKVKIQGHASGTGVLTVTAPNTSTDRTITLPDATGTLLNSDGDGSSLTGLSSFNPDAAVTINESGADVDFRVESNNLTHALFVDGGNDAVGIGTSTPKISGIYSDGTNNTIGGTYLTIRDDDADQCGILELASSQTATAKAVGGISFINHDNGSSEYQRKNIASITCRTVTSDSNAGDDSGGDIVFTNKPEYGDVAERLRITSDGRGLSDFTAKVWCRVNTSGTPAARDSHNVSSITDNGTGDFTVNFSNNMANNNYFEVSHTNDANHNSALVIAHIQAGQPGLGSSRVLLTNSGTDTAQDGHDLNYLAFGG
jgi:hypothetical protein